MPKIISEFAGVNHFLSNFYLHRLEFEGETYSTAEAAYQASKTYDPAKRAAIRNASLPRIAKTLGRKVQLRADWELVKVDIMEEIIRAKFRQPMLREKLAQTGDAYLIEGNVWGDTFWGICDGKGFNALGLLLMKIRIEIFQQDAVLASQRSRGV